VFAAAGCASIDVQDEDLDAGPSAEHDANRKPPPRDAGDFPRADAAGACGGLGPAGACAGETLSWCENGMPQSFDCGRVGLRCTFDDHLRRNSCTPETSADAAPPECEVPPEGLCDADGRLHACQGDHDQVQDCAATSRVCGWDDAAGRYACLAEPPPANACGGVTGAGHCVDGQVEVCRGDHLEYEDCPAQGSECQVVGGRATCVAPLPPDPCEGIPQGGECTGDTAVFCVDSKRVEFDCSLLGWVCFNVPQVVTLCTDPNPGGNGGGGGDPPLEGEGTLCQVDGVDGVCRRVSQCAGTATPGHCPGPAEVQCCN
jgi:hypothetical protein